MRVQQRYGIAVLGLAILAGLLAGTGRASAALIFYNSRTSFDAANPGLPVETFEAARVAPGGFATFNGPLSSTTNNAVFQPGEILSGLTVNAEPATPQPALVAVGTGTITGSTKAVGTNVFISNLALSFSPGVSSVGADILASSGPGPTLNTTFTINIFGASGLLGTTTVNEASGTIPFFGVSSDSQLITRITFSTPSSSEFADNVAFGTPIPPTPVSTPEPSSLALLTLGGVALTGWRRWKKRSVSA